MRTHIEACMLLHTQVDEVSLSYKRLSEAHNAKVRTSFTGFHTDCLLGGGERGE